MKLAFAGFFGINTTGDNQKMTLPQIEQLKKDHDALKDRLEATRGALKLAVHELNQMTARYSEASKQRDAIYKSALAIVKLFKTELEKDGHDLSEIQVEELIAELEADQIISKMRGKTDEVA